MLTPAEKKAYHHAWYLNHREEVIRKSNERQKTPKGKRSHFGSYLKRSYGLTLAEWERMFAVQRGLCAVCGQSLGLDVKDLGHKNHAVCVDHDHTCCSSDKSCGKCVRGLVHRTCNAGMGALCDDPVRLRAAADYIEFHRNRLVTHG